MFLQVCSGGSGEMHVCMCMNASAYPWRALKLFGVHVRELADLTTGGKADKNKFNFAESCVTASALKPLTLL